MELKIRADEVYTPFQRLNDVVLVIKDGVVTRILSGGQYDIDLRGYKIVPGFIDTHTHGCCNIDFTTNPESVTKWSLELVKFGTTAFLPTTVSSTHERLLRVIDVINNTINAVEGAKVLGLNFEGPYINPKRKGAQDPKAIRPPNINEFLEYVSKSSGKLRIITVAPEVDGGLELIQEASLRGVTPSIGHTDASYEVTSKAIALGASRATHLFDAMSGIHHREGGAAMALLEHDNVYLELIADLVHLKPETVLFTLRHVSYTRVVLITDSIAAAGLGDGDYVLGNLLVHVRGGKATLDDGTIAGSTLTMDKAVRNLVSIGIDLQRAVAMATAIPAISLGLRNMGCLKPGCVADMAVLDEKLNVIETYVDGLIKFRQRY